MDNNKILERHLNQIESLKKQRGLNVMAFIFGGFYFLYHQMGVTGVIFILSPAAIYMFLTLLGCGLEYYWGLELLFHFLAGLTATPLLIANKQKRIKKILSGKPDEPVPEPDAEERKRDLIFLGILLLIGVVWDTRDKKDIAVPELSPEQQLHQSFEGLSEGEETRRFIGLAELYLHNTEGVKAACENAGYNLHKYPQRFKDVYQREYQNLADMLSAKGVSWEDFLNVMRREMSGHLLQGAENKLDQIRRKLIISAMAHQDNVAPEKVEWKEEYVQILPLNRVCEFLDNGHELVFWEKDEIEQAVKQLKK